MDHELIAFINYYAIDVDRSSTAAASGQYLWPLLHLHLRFIFLTLARCPIPMHGACMEFEPSWSARFGLVLLTDTA
jgi:hypothetical protein